MKSWVQATARFLLPSHAFLTAILRCWEEDGCLPPCFTVAQPCSFLPWLVPVPLQGCWAVCSCSLWPEGHCCCAVLEKPGYSHMYAWGSSPSQRMVPVCYIALSHVSQCPSIPPRQQRWVAGQGWCSSHWCCFSPSWGGLSSCGWRRTRPFQNHWNDSTRIIFCSSTTPKQQCCFWSYKKEIKDFCKVKREDVRHMSY